jgi:hypothetical protein
VTITDLTPELSALVTAARGLSSEHLRQLTDFAEFLGAKYALPVAAEVAPADDDDVVDLSGRDDGDDVEVRNWADLSGVFRDLGSHSAIGLV